MTAPTARIQRVPEEWPVVHLEASPPTMGELVVDGLVRHPRRFSVGRLAALGAERRLVPLHCVWGWSRPDAVWDGVRLATLLDVVEPEGDHVTVASASGTYSACLPLADAAGGMMAWGRDGEPLSAEAGGPLRYVGPPTHWGYKGVKWAARVTVTDRFVPGFWESKVADPVGLIPADVVRP